ncbi:MAG: hypothetical protein BWY31_00602 [Lentisphaerae bacterium ADurb.Bin242]|nr:MAG: hypothetical protein BWY31_00602 [Lentisphaerae bacterium ADurb.Bin242]
MNTKHLIHQNPLVHSRLGLCRCAIDLILK